MAWEDWTEGNYGTDFYRADGTFIDTKDVWATDYSYPEEADKKAASMGKDVLWNYHRG